MIIHGAKYAGSCKITGAKYASSYRTKIMVRNTVLWLLQTTGTILNAGSGSITQIITYFFFNFYILLIFREKVKKKKKCRFTSHQQLETGSDPVEGGGGRLVVVCCGAHPYIGQKPY